jgi:hypothetical protein
MYVVKRICWDDQRTSGTKGYEEIEAPMDAIDERLIYVIPAVLLWLLAAGALWQGMRRLATGLGELDYPGSALQVVRGIRGVIVAVSAAALGGGVLFANTGLLVFGVIFLGEELYETGVVLLALRAGQRGAWAQTPQLGSAVC